MAIQEKIEAKKRGILKAAQKVFASRGFQETTISEIAKKAKVSEASIYEYFATKEGLLFSIPREAAGKLFQEMEFHLKMIRGSGNKLRSIIYLMLHSYQENPDFASVLMLILKHNRRFLETEGYQVIRQGIKLISMVLEEGVASREFSPDINTHVVRSMILGTIEHVVTNRVMTGTPENLVDLVDPIVDSVISGITPRGGSNACCCCQCKKA